MQPLTDRVYTESSFETCEPRMSRLILLLLISVSLLAADLQAKSRADIPDDETAKMRYFGQFWAGRTATEPLRIKRNYADEAFEKGRYSWAAQRYRHLAKYGDKFSQFRLGLIEMNDDGRRPDLPAAWAWFTLAAEGDLHPELDPYADTVWEKMSPSQQEKAARRLSELSPLYSDVALARRMQRIYKRELRSITGSRDDFWLHAETSAFSVRG